MGKQRNKETQNKEKRKNKEIKETKINIDPYFQC